jgi:hypothetical protein
MATLEDHIESIRLYQQYGAEPGSCTRAILENDLLGAVAHADQTSRYLLADIVTYLYNHVPRECWGDKARVAAWIARKGEKGL